MRAAMTRVLSYSQIDEAVCVPVEFGNNLCRLRLTCHAEMRGGDSSDSGQGRCHFNAAS